MMRLNCKILLCSLLTLSCGQSQFKAFQKERPEETATKALEQNRSSDAIMTMLDSLGTTFKQIYSNVTPSSDLSAVLPQLTAEVGRLNLTQNSKTVANRVSILASAQAQLYQIDILSIILKLVKEQTGASSGTSANQLLILFPVLPEATRANLQGVSLAITLMNSYDKSLLTTADKFKLAIFLTAYMTLLLKSIDTNGNGIIEPVELLNLSPMTAQSFLQVLHEAVITFLQSGIASGTDARSAKTAQKISDLETTILSQKGSSQADKLKNFLSK